MTSGNVQRTQQPRDAEVRPPDDIAIVGMACFVPGADNVSRYWQNIVHKVDCVGDPSPDWQSELFGDELYIRRGGFLGDLSRFNPIRYGIVPSSVEGGEPDQFLAFRCALDALDDAGLPEIPLNKEKTGVILGRGIFINRGLLTMISQGYMIDQFVGVLRQLEPGRGEDELQFIRDELSRAIPPFNAETVPGLTHNILAGRVANKLDLNGPAYTVDAACASTLLAVDHAVNALRSRECDAMLAGGVQVSTPGMVHQAFCYLDALSREGKIAPFSAEASGTLLGQGCGVVVLKRREDAERDGNRIYACIKGVGMSSDGRGSGLLAPRKEGQELSLQRAYASSQVDPGTVNLIEAHGTGIPLGDATEIKTLTSCFPPRAGTKPTVAVGSVKSQISHLIPASAAASLIKTALALYHRVLPPMLHAESANPKLELDKTPFYLSTTPRPWVHARRDVPRRAGVNAFGFGGINAHAILEEHSRVEEKTLPRLEHEWPVELVVVSANDRDELKQCIEQLSTWLEAAEDVTLLDVAASAAQHEGKTRLAIVASSLEDLQKKLSVAAKRLAEADRQKIQDRGGVFWYAEPVAAEGRVAFMFPGEGAQYTNMLSDLCRHFPEVRREFDLTDEAFAKAEFAQPLSRLIFPLPEEADTGEEELRELGGAVTSVTLAERALMALLRTLEIKPQSIVGHSSGEFGALMAAGAIAPGGDDALIEATAEGALNAVKLSESGLVPAAVLTAVGGANREAVDQVVASSDGNIILAMDNCPSQLVLIGDEEATAKALEGLHGKGGLCERLPWGRAYHTPAFEPACAIIKEYFDSVGIKSPNLELWSCATVDRFPSDPEQVKELALLQWRSPVRFRETVEAMYESGVRVFVEVGPRGNLAAFVGDTLGKKPHLSVPLDVPRKDGISQLCRGLGMLCAHGVSMNLAALYARREPKLYDFSQEAPKATPAEPMLRLDLPVLELSEEALAKLTPAPAIQSAAPTSSAPPKPRSMRKPPVEEAAPQPPVQPAAVPAPPEQPAPPQQPIPAQVVASPPTTTAKQEVRVKALADYQQTMRQFIATQQRVMMSRLKSEPIQSQDPGTPPTWRPAANAPASGDADASSPPRVASNVAAPSAPPAKESTSSPASFSSAPAATQPPEPPGVSELATPLPSGPATATLAEPSTKTSSSSSLEQTLLNIVSQRTGYPADMLDLDANLEADLGIDSIKRVEVIGAFRRAVAPEVTEVPSEAMETLTQSATLRSVMEGVAGLIDGTTSATTNGHVEASLNDVAIESLTEAEEETSAGEDTSAYAFIDTVVEHQPKTLLIAECELDVDRHRFLLDHTFLGRSLSTLDSSHRTLPVMPMAMSLELMAEAAAMLHPELSVVGMEKVTTQRWLAMESPTRRVRIEAKAVDDTHVHVLVTEADREGGPVAIVTAGTVVLRDQVPELGPGTIPDAAREPAPWAKDLYDWILFHGPAFQGIREMEACDAKAVRAKVREPDTKMLFLGDDHPPLVLPAALIDVASQVPGMIYGDWDPNEPEVHMVFPNSFAKLEFSNDRPQDEDLLAIARMNRDGTFLQSDVELKDDDGRVVLRMEGRVCQVVDFPTGLHHYSKAPHEVTCCEDISHLFTDLPISERVCIAETGSAGGPVLLNRLWSQVVSRMILSRSERSALSNLKLSPAALAYWLAGRIAVKDAMRLFLDEKLYMADVEIEVNELGKPCARIGAEAGPSVSIAHKEFKAVGVAASSDDYDSVGIDIEIFGSMDPGLKEDAFTRNEMALLERAAVETDEPLDHWCLSAWSAEEALGKALGRGVLGGPRSVEIMGIDTSTGKISMALRGPMAKAFPTLAPQNGHEVLIDAYRRVHGDYCIALCLIESLPG